MLPHTHIVKLQRAITDARYAMQRMAESAGTVIKIESEAFSRGSLNGINACIQALDAASAGLLDES
jgi:hypothetical protein